MRKLIARSLVAVLAVVAFSSTASAVPIPIGQLQWNVTDPQVGGQFSVVNQTGANQQVDPSCPLCFPVRDQMTFNADLLLAVDFDDASHADLSQGTGLSLNADGISWDSGFYLRPQPTLAILTGTVAPAVVQLDGIGWAGLWNIAGGIFTVPASLSGAPIEDLDTAIIYVNGERAGQAVPEPATFLLFGAGLIGIVARRRMVAKR
jgi:hypothetical protein